MKKEFFRSVFFIFLLSFLSVFDLFIQKGQPTTFDGRIHITSIAQYSQALLAGNFPVVWLSNFANYGLPVGLFSQQLPLYVGGLINIVFHNPVSSYNVLLFLSIFTSGVLFYKFLRLYVSSWSALLGVTLVTLSPFRILDIYVRGDLPEIFASMFLPLILLCIYYFIQKKSALAYFGLILSLAGLVLSHPMVFVIFAFIFIPYFFFLLIQKTGKVSSLLQKENLVYIALFSLAGVVGVGMTSYYLFPLALETKYLFFVHEPTHFDRFQILGWDNFFSPFWYRFTSAQFIKVGLVEMMGVIMFSLYAFWKLIQKKAWFGFGEFVLGISLVYIFLLTSLSYPLYEHTFLAEVQFSWRMLAGFLFLPPILFALLVDTIKKKWIVVGFIVLICVIRFPQLYGKNYQEYPLSHYLFTPLNLYSANMNTVWMQNPEDYPVKTTKAEILEHGKGTIISSSVQNNKRTYVIDAKEKLHMIDYTFYFPGWNVYIDNQPTPIEFQNYLYKGVITYYVPQGTHTVNIVFKDTLVRKVGKAFSLAFLVFFVLLVALRKKLFWVEDKKGKELLLFFRFGR